MRKISNKIWEIGRVAPKVCNGLCRVCGPQHSKTEKTRRLEGTVAQVPQQLVCALIRHRYLWLWVKIPVWGADTDRSVFGHLLLADHSGTNFNTELRWGLSTMAGAPPSAAFDESPNELGNKNWDVKYKNVRKSSASSGGDRTKNRYQSEVYIRTYKCMIVLKRIQKRI